MVALSAAIYNSQPAAPCVGGENQMPRSVDAAVTGRDVDLLTRVPMT